MKSAQVTGTQAGISTGGARAIVPEAGRESCADTCWPDPDSVSYSHTNWHLGAMCGTCGREVNSRNWRALARNVQDWDAL
jgi:hypothetical protein